jgi:DnaA-homolog protein
MLPLRQLPLPFSPASEPALKDFVPGGNAEALEHVRALASGTLREAVVYLWGDKGCGRTHLLRAAGRASPALVLADDVQRLDAQGQQALFSAINAAREGGPPVLAAGDAPPARLTLREDLRTRLAWGLVYHLKPLTDQDKASYLQKEAERRGLHLAQDVTAFLLSRFPRDLSSLRAVLDRIDRHALARQRRITLPLVRDALSEKNDG